MSIKKITEFATKQANVYRGGAPVRTIGNTPGTQAKPKPKVPTTYNPDGTVRTLGDTEATQQPTGPQYGRSQVLPGIQQRNPSVPTYSPTSAFFKNLFGIGGQSPSSMGAPSPMDTRRISIDPTAYIGDDQVRDPAAGGGSMSMGRIQNTPTQQAAQDAQLGQMQEQAGIRNQQARDSARLAERKQKALERQQQRDAEAINQGITQNAIDRNPAADAAAARGDDSAFTMQEQPLPAYNRVNPAARAAAKRTTDMAAAGGDPATAQNADMFNMEEDDSFFQNELASYRNRVGLPVDASRYSLPAARAPQAPQAPPTPQAPRAAQAPARETSQLEKDMAAGKLPWQQRQAASAAEYAKRTAATPQRPGVDNSRKYTDNRYNQMRKTQAPGRNAIYEKNLAAGDAARAAAKAESNRSFLAGGNARSTGANSSSGTSSLGVNYTRSVDPVTGRRSVVGAPAVGARAQAAGITPENAGTTAGRARANVLSANSRARRNANPRFAAYRQRMKNRRRSGIRR